MEALRSYGIPPGMVNMIAKAYENPSFFVEVDGVKSSWKTQQQGIRQGCPLSPYLFILAMNRVFEQVNENKEALTRLRSAKEFRKIDMDGLDIRAAICRRHANLRTR